MACNTMSSITIIRSNSKTTFAWSCERRRHDSYCTKKKHAINVCCVEMRAMEDFASQRQFTRLENCGLLPVLSAARWNKDSDGDRVGQYHPKAHE